MRSRNLIFSALFFACLAVPAFAIASDIAGSWDGQHMKVVIETASGDVLLLKQNNPEDADSAVGEIVGEASRISPTEWLGRHMWGGSKAESAKWGEPNGLYIRLDSGQQLFIQYRDSLYTDGWTLRR